MAVDYELQDLTELTTLLTTDILYVVHDPSGTPVSRKITAANLFNCVAAASKPTFAGIVIGGGTAVNDQVVFDDDLTFAIGTNGKVVKILAPAVQYPVFVKSATRAGATSPTITEYMCAVTTTDATATNMLSVAIDASTTTRVDATVVARRTGGAAGTAEDGASYEYRGTYNNIGGTPTIIGSLQGDYSAESQAAWGLNFVVSGSNINITVTGAANNNVSWLGWVRTFKVVN